ncbi:uncharacterized protein LOC103706355 isoform X2 [Phoenix dactylifera]|uniref:Uncharacterized protein LOC103706355 isoform X2 n=1 Tax=Phoenix dactylifera TaxID=42345 RepID=A0A8B7MTW2_PHODC|nr:uncharacterized protein LOC103706355 isoform X2 [Phoenix dactylifera]
MRAPLLPHCHRSPSPLHSRTSKTKRSSAVAAAAGMGGGSGREGDWECGGCRNRNYAFRSLCNRCKQPRLLVDTKTPADSKWLPRIGDWICTGCSNNNYASREKCKKCSQSKEEGALPAVAMPGVSLPTYAQCFAGVQELHQSKINFGITRNPVIHSFPPSSDWSYGGPDIYGLQSAPSWSLNGSSGSEYSYPSNRKQLPVVPKGWRDGDWICNCGFHNYSSRTQCKKCNAPVLSGVTSSAPSSAVSALRTKRLASEELVTDWDNKRLNAGDIDSHFLGFKQPVASSYDQTLGMYAKYSSLLTPSMEVNAQSAQRAVPTLLGKGYHEIALTGWICITAATRSLVVSYILKLVDFVWNILAILENFMKAKQWREGDWMCSKCNNHNFSSRSYCNRCKTQKEVAVHSGGVG